MSTMYLGGTDPPVVAADVAYTTEFDIIVNPDNAAETYAGIMFRYTRDDVRTVIQLTQTGEVAVSTITTHTVDGKVSPQQWKRIRDTFYYTIPAACANRSPHTISFTVQWPNGDHHDPIIVINPTNPGGDPR